MKSFPVKHLAATALLCLLATAAVAQVIPNGYATRFGEVSQAYAKDPTSVEALYDMAQFYFDNSHPMRNLAVAMNYARRAEEQHVYLLENSKIRELTRLLRRGIDLTALRQLKQAIVDAARNAVTLRGDMSLAEIDAWLEVFPDDPELVRQLRRMRITQVYNEAVATGNPETWYRYMVMYPGTAGAADMEERLRGAAPQLFAGVETLAAADAVAARFPQSQAVALAAEKCKSRMAFAAADRLGTMEAYNAFLATYPTSSESQQARDRLDALLANDFASRTTAMELARFADSNADLSLADEALARMRKLIDQNRDAEAARYYVSHFPLDPYYNTVYGNYYSWHTVEGNSAPLRTFAKLNPDCPFPGALESDLERAEAVDTFPLNVLYTEVDYERFASYVRGLMGKAIAVVPLQRMLQPLLAARNYKGALERMRQFDLCFENKYQWQYDQLAALLDGPAAPARALRREVDEPLPMIHPVVNTTDGGLYFTRIEADGSRTVRRAERRGNKWQEGEAVAFTNTEASDLTLFGFSPIGGRMILGSGGDIWFADRDVDGWRVSDIPSYPVNTDYVETDAYMLPDGSGMLLASDRPGGQNLQPSRANFHGDTALATDLWFIPFDRGQWGTPVNLGVGVNTPYCERSPLLSRNMKTLYFVSDGYMGLGYTDVMVAERTSTGDWTSWSTPRNAGREINSALREHSLSFTPDEKRVYLASELPEEAPYALRTGIYTFAAWHNTGLSYTSCSLGIDGLEQNLIRVRVADLEQQRVVQSVDYSSRNPVVRVNVRHDGRQVALADAGSLFVPAILLDSRQANQLQGYTLRQLVAADREVPLVAVGFADSSSELLPVARLQLEQLALFLMRNSGAAVELSVDVAGRDARACYTLSLARGEALRAFLAERGVAASRILLSCYGNVRSGIGGTSSVAVRFRD